MESYGFYIYRDFFGKLPFENGGIIDLSRNYYGYGTRLNFQKSNHTFELGIENNNQKDQRDRYQNLLRSLYTLFGLAIVCNLFQYLDLKPYKPDLG